MTQYKLIRGLFQEIDPKTLPKIDLVFSDPPDNIGLTYEDSNDNLPVSQYRELLTKWLCKCCAVTKGPVFFTFNERWTGCIERAIEDQGFICISAATGTSRSARIARSDTRRAYGRCTG